MASTVAGLVKNGVVVPNSPLPEGAHVEVRIINEEVRANPVSDDGLATRLTPAALRKLPREERQAILAAAAALAEEDYGSDKDLMGFDAFSEEELNDDESDTR
jgi:hypothetical protein